MIEGKEGGKRYFVLGRCVTGVGVSGKLFCLIGMDGAGEEGDIHLRDFFYLFICGRFGGVVSPWLSRV